MAAMSTKPCSTHDSPKPRIHYERRRPEETALYRIVQENVDTFFAQVEAESGSPLPADTFFAQVEAESGSPLPAFVKDEFDAFLDCGILSRGFSRLKCGSCRHEKIVAHSCKKRGICSACGARRMAETAAHLVDHVFPDVPVRQWVLSLPIPLRYLLASHPEMLGPVLEIVDRAISSFLIKKAGLMRREAKTGAVTFIQRFGSAAGNLNIHFHSLVIDGVYRLRGDKPTFQYVAAPTTEEMARLVERIAKRMMKLLARRGYLIEEEGVGYLEAGEGDEALGPLQAAACSYRIALGPRRGRKVWSIKMAEAQEDS